MMKREMPSLEEQEAVAWYVLERPLVRPNTSYRKAAFYVSLFLAVNSGITILLYYLLRWLGVSSFLPQVIWAFYTEHHIAFVILLTLLQFLVGGIIVLKPMMIGAIRLYQRYAPESVRRRCSNGRLPVDKVCVPGPNKSRASPPLRNNASWPWPTIS